MIAHIQPQSLVNHVRPFVFGGENTSGVQRQKDINILIVRLMLLASNVEYVVCDTFDRELIYRIQRLGLAVEEYPVFRDSFHRDVSAMQSLLMPNLYMLFGISLPQMDKLNIICDARNIPLVYSSQFIRHK